MSEISRSGRRPSRAVLLLAATLVLAALLAVLAWRAADMADRTERAGQDALASATAATQAIFSYDYRRFDASVANGSQFVTGEFAREYAETTATLKAAAEKERAIVRAEVSAAGVIEASPDRVDVLLYVNQYRRNTHITGEKVDQNRVVLGLVPADGEWKVVSAAAI
jgi:Mce-associated membrane protein